MSVMPLASIASCSCRRRVTLSFYWFCLFRYLHWDTICRKVEERFASSFSGDRPASIVYRRREDDGPLSSIIWNNPRTRGGRNRQDTEKKTVKKQAAFVMKRLGSAACFSKACVTLFESEFGPLRRSAWFPWTIRRRTITRFFFGDLFSLIAGHMLSRSPYCSSFCVCFMPHIPTVCEKI